MFVWNIETSHRKAALWASPAPPLTNVNVSKHSVCALLPGIVDRTEFVITAGTDQKIRYWNLSDPKNCSMVVGSPKENLQQSDLRYESRLVDGTELVQEIVSSSAKKPSMDDNLKSNIDETPRSGPELPSAGHHDVITDLALCKTLKQTFLVSSSRNGVIKLWK